MQHYLHISKISSTFAPAFEKHRNKESNNLGAIV